MIVQLWNNVRKRLVLPLSKSRLEVRKSGHTGPHLFIGGAKSSVSNQFMVVCE